MKSPLNETAIANALLGILERLDRLEHAANVLLSNHLASQHSAPIRPSLSVERAVLIEKLAKLTLKRHAVLTATLGGQSYQAIGKAMKCDVTTIKLHLKGALAILGVRNRSSLLANSSDLLGCISDDEYEARYGIGKHWWLTDNPSLMAVLTVTKPANNQYTKSAFPQKTTVLIPTDVRS